MLMMALIQEQAVIKTLNKGRFKGDIQGYVMVENSAYLGYALFKVESTVCSVLETSIEGTEKTDGIVRACVSAAENQGAASFCVNMQQQGLAQWWAVFCPGLAPPAPINHIFKPCLG